MLLLKIRRRLDRYLKGNEFVARNNTIEITRAMGVKIGRNCRIYSTNFSTEPFLITIGDHVTITDNVQFITHDGAVWVFRETYPGIDLFGTIKVGNNVFIGLNSILLPGTEIGNNVIVAAGSVLKGSYPDNSVVGGVPAKRIAGIEEYYNKNLGKFSSFKGISGREREERIRELFK